MISRNSDAFKTKHKQLLFFYFSTVIFVAFALLTFIFNTSIYTETVNFDENQQYNYNFNSVKVITVSIENSPDLYTEEQRNLSEKCPNAKSIVVTVLAGGRLGNQVWEYLSVWAVAQHHPGWWPAVPRQILNTLQPLFSPLAIPAIEDMAERCNAPFLLEELKKCPDGGNYNLLETALHDTNRTRPFLLVLQKYSINVNETTAHWPELRLQLPLTSKWQKLSEMLLHKIGKKIREAQNLKDDEPLEFVGVHVRRTDYLRYLKRKYSDAMIADYKFYLKAMDKMRRQLHPRHCAFVVVSDELDWCREHLTGAPDQHLAGTGDTKNPYFDLALLSACNHTILAYGTFSLTAAMQHPLGKTIVLAQSEYRDLKESCPNATSIVVTVLAGGRLGNQVWEYLSVWAVAQHHGWWPAVPRQILNTLQPLFSPLAIPAIEDLAERSNASFWIDEMKNCTDKGNNHRLKAALRKKKRTRPFLLVLPRYTINVYATADYWPELRLQLPLSPEMQNSSAARLHEIGMKIRKTQNFTDDEPLEFVGVHVRRTDYTSYIVRIAEDARAADHRFYLNAMEEMRRQLHPRHCAFVVVSDELAWCREHLTGAPDVEIAGTGDIKNPYSDLALLSACNHTVLAYGTFSLTAAMQNSLGKTIVHAQGGSKIAGVRFAKALNWTLV